MRFTMSEQPKVSVIMGIYNCEKTLPDAIGSIRNQTYSNWELILCDDASTDGTYALAKAFADRDDRILLIRNETNRRLAYSLNHCLQYATGELVARMDGDDQCVPERLETQIAFLREHPELQLCGTAMQRFNEEGLHDVAYGVEHPDYYTLRTRIPYNHATILTYKAVYDALGGYTVAERTKRAQDYDLWFRFYHAGFAGDNLKEPLYLVREDDAAIRRRTFRVRWNAFKTTRYGFRLLKYPRVWIVRPFLSMMVKSLIPVWAMKQYRKLQANRAKKG